MDFIFFRFTSYRSKWNTHLWNTYNRRCTNHLYPMHPSLPMHLVSHRKLAQHQKRNSFEFMQHSSSSPTPDRKTHTESLLRNNARSRSDSLANERRHCCIIHNSRFGVVVAFKCTRACVKIGRGFALWYKNNNSKNPVQIRRHSITMMDYG